MPAFADFASLAQLGAGVGLGLSVFRAPIESRLIPIRSILRAEIDALETTVTDFGRTKKRSLLDLELKLIRTQPELLLFQKFLLWWAAFGALASTNILAYAAVYSKHEASSFDCAVLLLLTVGWSLVIFAIAEAVAWRYLHPIARQLDAIRRRVS